MREVKFRAWDDKYKCMDYNFFISNLGGVFGEPEKYYDTPNIEIDIASNLTVMQYTGLKDKNGVEIYEGDIVDCYWLAELGVCEIDCQHKGIVRFVDCRFEVSFSDKAFIRNIGEDGVYSATELELTCMSHDDDYAVEYEVIGNIYENPELLKTPN